MTYKNILIIKIRALGDTLLATPSFAALKQAWPEAKLTALVSPQGYAILKALPYLDTIRVFDRSMSLIDYVKFIWKLRAQKFDLVIALHASFRTALIARLVGGKNRVVHNHSGKNYFSTLPITAKKEAKSSIERDLDAIRALGIQPETTCPQVVFDEKDKEVARDFIRQNMSGSSRGFMIVAPGAGKPRKTWPIENVISFLNRAIRQTDLHWVVLAGPNEQDLVESLNRQKLDKKISIFKGSVKSAAALMSLAGGMITADSGPKHIACAVGLATLTLWTDEPVVEWHPYDHHYHELIMSPTGLVADIDPELVMKRAQQHFSCLK